LSILLASVSILYGEAVVMVTLQYLAVSFHGSIIMYGEGLGTLQLIWGIISSSSSLKRLLIILE
jgi:hypothetical protein